jgi:uncharacterized protein (TIGR02996 family)
MVGMTDRESLLTAVLARPDDDTARLVLADFLREQPDPADVALGRFLWAGVVAARYRTAGVIEDAEFYVALAELSAVAGDGWPARWLADLGLGPSPLTARDWRWDNSGDRVTVRVGPAAGEFERGMLAGLTVTLDEWSAAAPAALAAWPVEGVSVADVPGMAFWVTPPEGEPGRWRLITALTTQEVPFRRRGWLLGHLLGPRPTNPPQPTPAVRLTAEADFPDRAVLVARIRDASAELVGRLRDEAGGRWPRPLPPGRRIGG